MDEVEAEVMVVEAEVVQEEVMVEEDQVEVMDVLLCQHMGGVATRIYLWGYLKILLYIYINM
jgi:hypothetical protein